MISSGSTELQALPPAWQATSILFGRSRSAKSLPPKKFEPVGTWLLSPAPFQPREDGKPINITSQKTSRFVPFGLDKAPGSGPQPMINMLLRHGVRSCLEYVKTGDISKAGEQSNPQMSPHLSFLSIRAGTGMQWCASAKMTWRLNLSASSAPSIDTLNRTTAPLNYRVRFRRPCSAKARHRSWIPKSSMSGARVRSDHGSWSGREDLNLRPPGPEPGALPG